MFIKSDAPGANVSMPALTITDVELNAKTLAAWTDYQATGQHVTAAEADVWLAKLEVGEDADPPECYG